MLTLEHIDPRKGALVSGLENEFNEIIADASYNYGKQNRFVPYRVCEYPAPVTYGDIGEFLIEGEWVVCEFGGKTWKQETKKIGFGATAPATVKQKQSAKITGNRNAESGHLKSIAHLGGKKASKLGTGIHAPGQNSKAGKIGGKATAKQKWGCLVTGRIMNPGNLSQFQKRNGIDPSLRRRIS